MRRSPRREQVRDVSETPGRVSAPWKLQVAGMLCAAGILCVSLPLRAQDPASLEYQVKASYIFNFMQFVRWPEGTPAAAGDSLVLGIVGEDRFGDILDALEGQKVWGKTLTIRRFGPEAALGACHAIFIDKSVGRKLLNILERIKNKPMLTIGDTEGFAEHGGMIELVRVSDKIRFSVNAEKTREAGLFLPSQLLRLAMHVRGN